MAYIGKQPTPVPLTSEDIADGTITNTDIATDAAIAQTKLAALSIATANIEDDAITAAKINDGEIVNAAVSATAAIDDTKIAPPYYLAVANFPPASDHHGRVAHAHSEGAMYYSHGGSWIQLADNSDIPTNTAVLSADQTFTAANRGTITADNDGSFDLAVTNNFSCTPATGTTAVTLTFTNIASAAGQTGNIILDNGTANGGAGATYSLATNTIMNSTEQNRLSAAKKFWLSYFCDGTNVYVTASVALN